MELVSGQSEYEEHHKGFLKNYEFLCLKNLFLSAPLQLVVLEIPLG
jgi:hypothetical protein